MQTHSILKNNIVYTTFNTSLCHVDILKLLGIMVACFASLVFSGEIDSATKSSSNASKRNILFSHIQSSEGLSQPAITSIVQDDFGFMWFGTQEGLNRYDGKKIEVYTKINDDSSSLSNDWVWTMNVDNTGTLWIGTDGGGLNRYNYKDNNFTRFNNNSNDSGSLCNDRVRVIYQDNKGTHWIGTDGGGLCQFDPASGKFTQYQHDAQNSDRLNNNAILAIHEDRRGLLWIGTNGGGLASLDRSTNSFTYYLHESDISTSLSSNQVRAIHEDRDGNLWIGTYKTGLDLFNPREGSFRHFKHDPENSFSLSNNKVRDIFQDRDGHLWIATDGGLNEWIPEKQQFVVYQNNSADSNTLTDNRVSSIFQDKGGILWVGTWNGLNKWNYLSDSFNYYQNTETDTLISSNIVTAIAQNANTDTLIGTYGGGLDIFNDVSGLSTHYKYDESDASSLSDNRVMSISIDQDQTVWLGTRAGGLNKLNSDTGSFTRYMHDPEDPSSLSSNGITSILNEANGQIWVGTYGGGLNLGNTDTGKFTAFKHNPDDDLSISSNRVLAIFRDRKSNLWIGTENGGLNRYNEKTKTFIHYRHNSDDPTSISSDAAWAITESSDGTLWIGTNGGGLNSWNAEDQKAGLTNFTTYGKNEGLQSESITAVIEDLSNNIWLSSNRGLTRFNPQNGDTLHFGYKNGLKGDDFNFAARFRNRSGRLFFGGSSGLVTFLPSQIRTNQHQPDIALTASSRTGIVAMSSTAIPLKRTIELGYKDDLISFDFVGLDYASPSNNLYRYKLVGFDNEWSKEARFPRTTYTNLPAGSYEFQVQASNNVGIWNIKGSSIKFNVIPPPWLTIWAYITYILIAAAILIMFVRSQHKKLETETVQRHELENQVRIRTSELGQRNSELEELNIKLKESSWTDSLTGLKNRRYLSEFIEAEVALVNRHAKETAVVAHLAASLDSSPKLSFMMIDLDGFKAINDTYGHHCGDQALIHVRDILLSCCRKSDIVIRWGGDEFLIVSRDTSSSAAEKLAERIRQNLSDMPCKLSSGHLARLTGSIGFAGYPFSPLKSDLFSWEQVSDIADRAAYIAKANGRNAWVGIDCTRKSDLVELSQIRTDLEGLLGKGQIDIRSSVTGRLKLSPQARAIVE